VRHGALDEPTIPTIYLSEWQAASRSSYIVVRSARPDADALAIVAEEVARLDRDLPVYGRQSMSELIAASPGVPARRVLSLTFLAFALLAVVLAAVGLFGVAAHDVARRRAELALRVALGADPQRIANRTLGQGARMIVAGLIAGGVLSIWAVRAVSGVVFVADYPDAISITGAAALLVAAGAAAVFPAARRAARTDPVIVFRTE
jgi:ABC-type antimicrobial peptide transport system permease subunit